MTVARSTYQSVDFDASFLATISNGVQHIREDDGGIKMRVNVPRVINVGDMCLVSSDKAEPLGMLAATAFNGTNIQTYIDALNALASAGGFLGIATQKRIIEQAGPPKDLSIAQIWVARRGIFRMKCSPLTTLVPVGTYVGPDAFINAGGHVKPDGTTATTSTSMYFYPDRVMALSEAAGSALSMIGRTAETAPVGQSYLDVALNGFLSY